MVSAQALQEAGLRGDFNLHINPYLQGPVTAAADWLAQRARFIVDSAYASDPELTHETVLRDLHAEEARLASASRDYERVVLWLEHDRYDQFVLIRCLAWFAEHGAPQRLELVGPNDFPGASHFVGLGQLPPEALRLLWQQRTPISAQQIAFALEAWNAFRSDDPRRLAAFARQGTPLLPHLAAALHRHLQDLPSLHTGLGLTQRLLLEALAQHESVAAGRLVGAVMLSDPLPGLGDSGYEYELRQMEAGSAPALVRTRSADSAKWRHDMLAITAHGRELLAGARNWLASMPKERWVGGVRIATEQQHNWYWDEGACDVVLR
jgi:hypothetical protein